jgi:hypothetical protein
MSFRDVYLKHIVLEKQDFNSVIVKKIQIMVSKDFAVDFFLGVLGSVCQKYLLKHYIKF